jgi:Fic family protein
MTIKYHHPQKLVLDGMPIDYNKFGQELEAAQYVLGRLEEAQKRLGNSSLLMAPLTAKEAEVSSRIEGTQTTASEVFAFEAGAETQHSDARQVSNYRGAMTYAMNQLDQGRNISAHLIKTLQQRLLQGVRHEGQLGDFRQKPVWIAEKRGDPIEKAIYVPPEHILVPEYIDNLLEYIEKGKESALVKAGVIHYQFEAVHPFEDGNGRIGRLMIPLVLCQRQKLSQPILYVSGYFDAHREEYLEALHGVDKTGKFEPWLNFFLKSVSHQMKETQNLVEEIQSLHSTILGKFDKVKSPYLHKFVDLLFKKPVFTTEDVSEIGASSPLTVTRLRDLLIKEDIIREMPVRLGRFKLYVFHMLLDLIK